MPLEMMPCRPAPSWNLNVFSPWPPMMFSMSLAKT